MRVVKAGVTNPQILLGVFFEALFFACLLMLMSESDISFLWPLTALSFVFATFAAHHLPGANRSPPSAGPGWCLIMVGAALISYSEHVRPRLSRQARRRPRLKAVRSKPALAPGRGPAPALPTASACGNESDWGFFPGDFARTSASLPDLTRMIGSHQAIEIQRQILSGCIQNHSHGGAGNPLLAADGANRSGFHLHRIRAGLPAQLEFLAAVAATDPRSGSVRRAPRTAPMSS